MRVLLDENLPRRLKRHFAEGIEAVTVQERGWSGKRNGEFPASKHDQLYGLDKRRRRW